MTKTEIIAAMTVAYGVANVDGLKEDEAAMLIKELKSYKFANDPEQYQEALANYKKMPVLEGINVIAQADEAARKEAHALTIYAMCGDGEASDHEVGAYRLMKDICNFPPIEDLAGAKAILGF